MNPFSFFQKKPQPQNLPTSPRLKTLAELEAELDATLKPPSSNLVPQQGKRSSGCLGKIVFLTILLGLPVTILAIINLPFPAIRRPIAKKAPVLLFPSYFSLEQNYKGAIAAVNQAQQLIDNPTSNADLELGSQKLEEAQQYLDAIPLWFNEEDWPRSYGWYNWQFSLAGFDYTRATVATLTAKSFQEKNAQTLLVNSENTLIQAKQAYQQAKEPMAKQGAIDNWRKSLAQLQQIPRETFAGRLAQQKLTTYQLDYEQTIKISTQNQELDAIIKTSQAFAMQAAQLSQNPPHTSEKWQKIEQLWQQALSSLNKISVNDSSEVYMKAQELIAKYTTNLSQISLRRQIEEDSVKEFQQAESEINNLLQNLPKNPRDTVGKLQSIIFRLEQVKTGTTVYQKAQILRQQAQAKLKELEAWQTP